MATNEELQAQIDILRAQVVVLVALVADNERPHLGQSRVLSDRSRKDMLDKLISVTGAQLR